MILEYQYFNTAIRINIHRTHQLTRYEERLLDNHYPGINRLPPQLNIDRIITLKWSFKLFKPIKNVIISKQIKG